MQGAFSGVGALALSPDDRVLAAGGFNGTVVLFDTRTRRRIGRPLQLVRGVGGLDFSSDGRLLALAGPVGEEPDSQRVMLVDIATRKVVREIDPGPYPAGPKVFPVVDVRFDARSRALVVMLMGDGSRTGSYPPYLRRYDVRTGRPLGRAVPIGRRLAGVALTVPARRDRLLVSGADETFVVDAATLRVRRRFPVGGSTNGLSPDGRSAALGHEDGSVVVLDLRTGKLRTLAGRHEDRVQGVEFTPDGRTLASRGDDGRILIWNLRSGTVRETLTGHAGPITRLLVGDDGRTLYTGGVDNRIIDWDIAGDRRLAHSFQGGPIQSSGTTDYPPPLAISPSGRTVAAGREDGGVRLHGARTLLRLRELPGIEKGPVLAVEFHPDGRTIAVTGEGGGVEMRDVATGRRVRAPLAGLGTGAQALAFSPGGGLLAVADLDGNLRVMELATGDVRRVPRLAGIPIHVSFSPDGKLLALGLADRGTELRDSRSLRIVARLRGGPGDTARWVRFSPDGRVLAVSAIEGYTQLWDVVTRRRIGTPLAGHEFDVLNAEFSPDGRVLASSGVDGTVILWDVASRRALGTLPGPFGRASARFTPDGRQLFVLRDSGAAQRWEVSPEAWSRHACRVAARALTRAEWAEFVPDQPFRPICGA